MSIFVIIIIAIFAGGIAANDHIENYLKHRFKLKSAEMEVKKLEAQARVLRLKADPKCEEREAFVKHALEAHDDLSS